MPSWLQAPHASDAFPHAVQHDSDPIAPLSPLLYPEPILIYGWQPQGTGQLADPAYLALHALGVPGLF